LEAVSGQDTLATQLQAINTILEDAAGLDGVATTAILNIAVVESSTGESVFEAAFLWNPINTTQSANWSGVENAQTSGWTPVITTQMPGWTPINT